MHSDDLFFRWEIAAALFLGAVGIANGAIFGYAYSLRRRWFLLFMSIGSFLAGLADVYPAFISYMTLINVNLLPVPTLHVLAWTFLLTLPVAGISDLIGAVLLLRFLLSLRGEEKA